MNYFENKIYIQTPHKCVRNKSIVNVNTSSDYSVFTDPPFVMSGASKIPCDSNYSAITSGNSYVYIIDSGTTQDLTFEFTGDTATFTDNDTTFNYEIYKLNSELGYFQTPPQYKSEDFNWSVFSATTIINDSVDLETLKIDGEYLIKGYFKYDVCTLLGKEMGLTVDTSEYKSGESFGLYQPTKDFYMTLIREADEPIFDPNAGLGGKLSNLSQVSVIPEDGQTYFVLTSDMDLDFIVTLNGLVLSKDYDYSVGQYSAGTQPYTITMMAKTYSTDILTYIYVGNGQSGGLKTDTINVLSILSGNTDGEGNNSIYYNTDTNKYEVFLSITPSSSDGVLLMLNGVTLANGIDFYQSISNPKRLIIEGTILVGDILTIAYNSNAEFVGSINTSQPIIRWNILNPPTEVNGEFILEFATDRGMVNQISSGSTSYNIGEISYFDTASLSGTVGTELYYRVTNIKNYTTLCGDVIESTVYSEIIPMIIATNSINSY